MALRKHAPHPCAVMRGRDAIAFAGQIFLHDIADLLLVVDDQDMAVLGHLGRSPPCLRRAADIEEEGYLYCGCHIVLRTDGYNSLHKTEAGDINGLHLADRLASS